MFYRSPSQIDNVNQDLLYTFRRPMDAAYAIQEIYFGIYSSIKVILSPNRKFENHEISVKLFTLHLFIRRIFFSSPGVPYSVNIASK